MPSNTRGKIKEHSQGIHKNTEAIKTHCTSALALIADKNPEVSLTYKKLYELADILDEFNVQLYSLL